MDSDIVERLELKIAYLERASLELSDVVYAQQRQIDSLKTRLAELEGQLAAARTQGEQPYTLEEEKPPHY